MVGDDPLVLLLYVDDSFITGRERPIAACKKDLVAEYEMTHIGVDEIVIDANLVLQWPHGMSLDPQLVI